MSKNIKIGNDVLQDVTTIKFEDAENPGQFVEFLDTTDANATAGEILNGKTGYVNGTKITGTIPSKAAQTYTPTTTDQTIASGQYLSGTQTVLGDANLVAGNIKKDVSIFGVTGTHEGGITPTGNIDITTTSQVDVTNYATAQVVDADLVASNIKKDVNILGVTGTYEAGGVTPTGNQDISTLNEYDVTNYATARVSAAERAKIIPQNIANGITILGIEGIHQGGVTPTGSINITTNGTYDVTEYASAVVAIPSAEGYSITTNLTGGTATGSTATFGSPNTAQVTLTASSGYILPTSVSVTGADFVYNNSTGVITLTNATGNVTITAVFRKSYTITGNITNGSLSGASTIIENGTAYVTLTPSANYYTPAAISVAGASFTYDFTSGQIYLSNPTENVEINATCIQPYTITGNITNGTMSGDSTILDGRTASVTITPNSSFVTPNSVTVANANYTYDIDTGVISLSNATGNVTITAVCGGSYSITGNITNGSLTGDSIIGEGRTATVTIVGSEGYSAPEVSGVTVTNATIASYSGGELTLSNPTGNVTVTATCVEAPEPSIAKGDIINIDMTGSGTPQQYRVVKNVSGNVYEVFSMADVNSSIAFDSGNTNTYEGKTLDTYLNSTWYGTLSSTAKNALVAKTFTQDNWYSGTSGNPVYQGKYSGDTAYKISLDNAAFGNEITRNVYVLSIQDIIDYLGVTPEMTTDNTTLTYNNIWQMFWNDTTSHSEYPWLRSANAGTTTRAFLVRGGAGRVYSYDVSDSHGARAAFQIDLTKISWTK